MRSMTICIYALALVGCRKEYFSDQPFDAPIDCVVNGMAPFETLDEAIAAADVDGDGALTDADARPGEAVFVIRVTGRHERSGWAAPPGYTVHSNLQALLTEVPFEDAVWGVNNYSVNCYPSLSVWLWFPLDRQVTPPTASEVLNISAYLYGQMLGGELDDETVADGTVYVTRFDPDGASGFFEGTASIRMYAQIPRRRLTGQTVVVDAMAWRDIPLNPAR